MMTVDKIIEDKAMKTWKIVFIGVFLQADMYIKFLHQKLRFWHVTANYGTYKFIN